jgi:hypothetical protein
VEVVEEGVMGGEEEEEVGAEEEEEVGEEGAIGGIRGL